MGQRRGVSVVKFRAGMVGWIVFAILAAAIGYGAGLHRGQHFMLGEFQATNGAELTRRVEVLSVLRIGETPGAIAILEEEADSLARTIARNKPIAQNRSNDEFALSYFKTYLSAVPPSPLRAKELAFALDGLPLIQPGKCKTNLKLLLYSRPRDSSQ
jgi:hypothetical protein